MQVVKSSTKHQKNQNVFMKKFKLHPRYLMAGLKPTQKGLISVSLQLSCPSVKDTEASHSLCEDKLLPVDPPGFTLRGDK